MSTQEINVEEFLLTYENKSPVAIIKKALETFQNIAISFSGAEDVVLLDMATKIKPDVKVFTLDTGRLHPETYSFIELVRKHYELDIEILFPDYKAVERLVKDKGLFSFYNDGHKECCSIRKVEPLARKLSTLSAWMTGQRKDQSPDTRNDVPVIQVDEAFSKENKKLFKFNPLANWSSADVWDYIRENNVPYNQLHEHGYISIGCEPCTRPILPNQHERIGRWWWEESTMKECGLHIKQEK